MRHTALFCATLLLAGCQPPTGEGGGSTAALDPVLPIGQVQGEGARSPYEGRRVTVEGWVGADFGAGLGGVFLQSLEHDGNPATSEGLFLARTDPALPVPKVGDRVRATGTVRETGDGDATLTTLEADRIEVTGRFDGAPLVLDAAADGPADWEPLEGRLVRFAEPLTISGNDGLSRYGELVASFGGRLFTPTEVAPPGPGADAVAASNAARRLVLDDGTSKKDVGNPAYLAAAPDAAAPLRAGSVVTGATGVLDQRFGSYRLQVTEPLAIEQAPRPAPPTVPGDRRIAGFNVLNLFNGDGEGGGFPTERGARTPADYARQQAKLVAVVQALDPDLAALMELENDGYGPDSSLAQFVAALNAAGPHDDWRFVDAGDGPGTNPIRVALIYRAGRFQPVGKPAVLAEGPFLEHSRVPLAQAFRAGDGPVFVVAANHFKSKGSCDKASGADVDRHDGQACWNATRVESARRLHDWLATDPTGTAPAGALVIGDLNAHAQEDPLRLLRSLGWQDALARVHAEAPYSFVWAGESGRLDHALLDAGLAARLRGAAEWHNNADESDRFAYYGDASGPEADPWRASDHDPLLLGLDLAE